MKRLDSIGFDWDPYKTAWHEQFQQLVAFAQRHGHVKIPKVSMVRLHMWLYEHRRAYHHQEQQQENEKFIIDTKNVLLSYFIAPERIRLLEEVPGFEWNPWDASWKDQYQESVDYHATHGHCLVHIIYPDNPPLGEWVAMQRKAYKRYVASRKDDSPTTPTTAVRRGTPTVRLTPERIEFLNQIDFFHHNGRDNMKKKQEQPNDTKELEQTRPHKKEEE